MNANKEPLLFLPDDDFDDSDEYPEIDVEALNAQVDAHHQEPNFPLRTTILTEEGLRIGPAMMTAQEAQDCFAANKRDAARMVLSEGAALAWTPAR